MFTRIVRLFDQIFRRYTPDPFLIAVLLTGIVLLAALTLTDTTWTQALQQWGDGFWSLIAFTLQMTMILLGGYVIATAPVVQRLLERLARRIRGPSMAIVVTTLLSCMASWLNWGFGLVTGAFIAVEMARHVPGTSFRLLLASAYSGFLVWHGGLSGSIPLLVNTPGNFSEKWLGGLIPISETLFAPFNIAALLSLMVVLPLLNVWMGKGTEAEEVRPPAAIRDSDTPELSATGALTPAEKLERSRVLMGIVAAFGALYLGTEIAGGRFSLDLNRMNYIFLFAGILLHGRPRSFLRAVDAAASKVGPILVQYPFYGGIMGIMTASGLAKLISDVFIEISGPQTLPLFAFWSAGIVNFFVPSGGGQWAVQGPIVIPAAQAIGADLPKTIMAVAWGDAWTNMAQPFWALPLLAIAGLRARDIMGYCVTILLVSGAVLSLVFVL